MELIDKYISDIKNIYFEEHRKFHNWEHIDSGLNLFKKVENKSIEQLIAWIYHDVIYNPFCLDNEYKSAMKALNDIKLNKDELLINTNIVSIIINDTKLHIPTIEESKIVLDIDMSSLALENYEDFLKLRILAASEYSFLGKEVLINGTKKFLNDLLSSEKIYHSNHFNHLNKIAFSNLKRYYNDFESNKDFLGLFNYN